MSFANFLQRFRARQQAPPPALPPVPAYQGPIRQDLNLFELTGQTMGAPAAPLSTEAQALAQLANFMALRQQAQGGTAPPVLGPLAETMARTPNTLGSSVPMPPLPEPGPRSTYAMPPAVDQRRYSGQILGGPQPEPPPSPPPAPGTNVAGFTTEEVARRETTRRQTELSVLEAALAEVERLRASQDAPVAAREPQHGAQAAEAAGDASVPWWRFWERWG